jgi:hypothetical protein
MKTSDQITCEAFARAIPSIGQPSTDLKTSVDILLRQIHSPQFSEISAPLAAEIRALVEEYPELDQVYQVERQKLQREYRNSDRAKGISAAIPPNSPIVLPAKAALKSPTTRMFGTDRGSYSYLQSNTQDQVQSPLTAAKLDILRAIDKRPYTTQDLISYMDITTPPDQVSAMVQSLWLQGYVDTLSGGLLRKFFPVSKGRSPQPLDPDASLTLTSKGHFSVHPIFRFGSQKAMFR